MRKHLAVKRVPGEETSFRYERLADTLAAQIRNGAFRAGDRLPSIRNLRDETGLSISTVYHAFIELEKRGLVTARNKSGYYVQPLVAHPPPTPGPARAALVPHKVTVGNLAVALCEAMADPDVIQLGGAVIAPELLPAKELAGLIKTMSHKDLRPCLSSYGPVLGDIALRRRIARRLAPQIGRVAPDDIVITNGCIDAVSLCLKAVAKPGDTILVESPTFPWFLQIIEDGGMYALEIPGSTESGIDLSLLEEAVCRHRVRAGIFNVNFSNPLGSLMSDQNKAMVVDLLTKRGIVIIEDDIYGELYFGQTRPFPLKSYDKKGMVLYCGSFSKSLSPGLRIGWALPGYYLEKVRRLKMNHAISHFPLPQRVAAWYLGQGLFDRHLRRLRACLKRQISSTAMAVARSFPLGTKISAPKGGLTLWVQLPSGIDSLELFKRAYEKKIAVMPGIICAGTNAYDNCIRLNCGSPYTPAIEESILRLASTIREMI